MEINELLHDFGNQIGITDLALDDDGLCSISFDDRFALTVELNPDDNGFYVYASLGIVPVEHTMEAYTKLLQANYFGHQTGQAFFCISPESEEVFYMQRFTGMYHALLDKGYYLPPSSYEVMFISAAHTEHEIDGLADAMLTELAE